MGKAQFSEEDLWSQVKSSISPDVRWCQREFPSTSSKQVFKDIFSCFFRCSEHDILDLSFYDDRTLSVLLQEKNSDCVPVLAQVSMETLENANAFTVWPRGDVPLTQEQNFLLVQCLVWMYWLQQDSVFNSTT